MKQEGKLRRRPKNNPWDGGKLLAPGNNCPEKKRGGQLVDTEKGGPACGCPLPRASGTFHLNPAGLMPGVVSIECVTIALNVRGYGDYLAPSGSTSET